MKKTQKKELLNSIELKSALYIYIYIIQAFLKHKHLTEGGSITFLFL